MLNILAIYGSPRRNQNSDTLLNQMLKGMDDEQINVKRIYASDLNIKSCIACEGCYKTGRCVIKDEMHEIYGMFNEADIIITATPLYFYTVTSELKKLIDRCQAVWASKYMAKTELISRKPRLGYIICTGGAPESEFHPQCAISVIELFYKCINTEFYSSLMVSNVDKIHVKERSELLEQVYKEGNMLLETYIEKASHK